MTHTVAAKIAARDTKGSGITVDLATKHWPRLGHTFPVVATIRVAEHTEDEDGPKSLKYELDFVEPANNDHTAEHLRELQRALYMARDQRPKLGDPDEHTVADIVRGFHGEIKKIVNDPESGIDSVTFTHDGSAATIGADA